MTRLLMEGDFWIRGDRISYDSTQISIVGPQPSPKGADATILKPLCYSKEKKNTF